MRTALVHDWLVSIGGGEKALQAIDELFKGDIYTLFHNPKSMEGTYFQNREVITSFLQKMPFAKKKYQTYLPFFPLAIEGFDLSDYDLVISSSHCAAKGVLTHAEQLHICYCYTPMRYGWDLYHQYLDIANLKHGVKGFFAKLILHYLRLWDKSSASRVDAFMAISNYVARRIAKVYGRKAEVIYPGVNVDYYSVEGSKDDYYVTASRLVPYKRIDLIVEAFSLMKDKKLIVVGDGPEMGKIKKLAGKNVELTGYLPDQSLRPLIGKAKAFVFAALEDFGILPVEAQAAGTPVIAFGKGGSLETVGERCGVFFQEQTVKALCEAISRFEKMAFDPSVLRAHAAQFSIENFKQKFKRFVEDKLDQHKAGQLRDQVF